MTEAEWLACDDPTSLLKFLRGKASDRKVRLFGVASCWLVERILGCAECVSAIKIGEQFADGGVSDDQRRSAHAHIHVEWVNASDSVTHCQYTTSLSLVATDEHAWGSVFYMTAREAADSAAREGDDDEAEMIAALSAKQPMMVRDIFGNPFRPSAPLPHAVVAWNDGTVRRIAEGIYADRAFNRLPILADALLDAGCDDEELLAHCRSAGVHVRGCWAVDTILNKC